MTFPRSSPWLMLSAKQRAGAIALLLGTLLTACSETPTAPQPEPTNGRKSARQARAEEKGHVKVLSSKYLWGVQYFEAGKYKEALDQFRRLGSEGAENPYYFRTSFYEGMSHYHLGQFAEATPALKKFLAREEHSSDAQDARLALLSIYERTQAWEVLLGLAVETDKLTLYSDNRAYLKLLWARALEATGENKGARAELAEAQQYLSGDPDVSARLPDTDRDLWGRYNFVSILLDLDECRKTSPKEVHRGKKSVRRLYDAWIDSSVDCLRKGMAFDEKELLLRDSQWRHPATEALDQNVELFGKRLAEYLDGEKGNLDTHRNLQAAVRSGLYRLLSSFDDAIKDLKSQGLGPSGLAEIRKRIDNLLTSLSNPL